MITVLGNRRWFALCLAAVCVALLPPQICADELRYLPDDAQIIASIDLTAARKTKASEGVLKQPGFLWLWWQEPLTAMLHVDGRATMSWAKNGEERVLVYTGIKPLTIADSWAILNHGSDVPKLPKTKEIKHGTATIYQLERGPTLAIDGKTMILSRLESQDATVELLKKIIDRNQPARLSATMQAGLKQVDFTNTFILVVDFQGLSSKAPEKRAPGDVSFFDLFNALSTAADINANIGKVRGLAFKINEAGQCKASATLLCKDAASAGILKGIAERSLADVKLKVKDLSKEIANEMKGIPADDKRRLAETEKTLKMVDDLGKHVDSIKVASADRMVTASCEVEPARVIETFVGWRAFAFTAAKETSKDGPQKK